MATIGEITTRFWTEDTGAITVDWFVMTAAVVGLGVGATTVVRSGTDALGTDVQSALNGAQVASLGFDRAGLLQQNHVDHRLNIYPEQSVSTLTRWHQNRVADFMRSISQGNNEIGNSLTTFGAGQYLDIMRLQRDELMARGAYPVQGLMTYEEAYTLYIHTF